MSENENLQTINAIHYLNSIKIEKKHIANFGYWQFIGFDYPIKLTIDEVIEILEKRLNKN